jgi:hypothetical protein
MADTLIAFVKVLAKILFAVALVIGVYSAWIEWSLHKVRAFCGDVKLGVEIAALAEIASLHGVTTHWVQGKGVFSSSDNDWFLPVPVEATLGDVVCAIRHDGERVISAEMEGD